MKPRNEDDALRRSMVARRVAICLGVLALALALGVSLYAVVAIRETQKTNAPKIDKTAETLAAVQKLAEKIDSCTDPKGKCAKQGQKQTAAAVGSIKADTRDVVVAALVCQARGVKGFDATVHCADEALALRAGVGR